MLPVPIWMNHKLRILVLAFLVLSSFEITTVFAAVLSGEEIWRSLEKLSPEERNKKLVEGAKKKAR